MFYSGFVSIWNCIVLIQMENKHKEKKGKAYFKVL